MKGPEMIKSAIEGMSGKNNSPDVSVGEVLIVSNGLPVIGLGVKTHCLRLTPQPAPQLAQDQCDHQAQAQQSGP